VKRCKKCSEVKELSEFYKAAGTHDGYRSECKVRHLALQKVWYRPNRGKAIADVKRCRQENQEHLNE